MIILDSRGRIEVHTGIFHALMNRKLHQCHMFVICCSAIEFTNLRLQQNRRNHPAAFCNQDIVGAAGRRGGHALYTNTDVNQRTVQARVREALRRSGPKQQHIRPEGKKIGKVLFAQFVEADHIPVAVNLLRQHHDALFMAFSIDHDMIFAARGELFCVARLGQMQFQSLNLLYGICCEGAAQVKLHALLPQAEFYHVGARFIAPA